MGNEPMSGFVTSGLAWAALALASIPIIIHLLNRRKLRKMEWAAMEFLLAALKKTRRRLRLEHLILLILRTLMMILLALFLARPMLSDTEYSWLAGAFKSEEKVFVLDDSLSMNRNEADGTTFRKGREALARELERLGRGGSRDSALILRPSRPRAAIRGSFADEESVRKLLKSVRLLQPTGTRMDLSATIDNLAELSSTSETGLARPRSLSIITDLRAIDWTDGAGGANDSLKKALGRLAQAQENPPRIIIYDVGSEDTANLSIADVSIEGGRPTVGIPAEIHISIDNFSSEAVRNLRVQLTFGPLSGKRTTSSTAVAQPIPLIEGASRARATVTSTFRSAGRYWVEAQLMGVKDPLPGDNLYTFVIDVVEASEVLLVNGEPSSEPWEGETDFVANALSPGAESSFGILPVVVTEDNLPQASLGRYNAVFLANTYSLPEDFRRSLGRFVAGGGTLVIFPGDQADPAVWSRELGKGDAGEDNPWSGLLPAELGKAAGSPGDGWSLRPDFNHPYFRLLSGDAEPYLQQVLFEKFWLLQPAAGSRIIAGFSDPDSSPAIVEKSFGKGRTILFATTADDEWHDWPPNATFPILLRQIMDTIGKERGRLPEFMAGQPIEVPIDVSEHKTEARYLAVDERSEGSLKATPVKTSETGKAEFRFLVGERFTLQAGLFRIGLDRVAGTEREWRALAIRSDPEESNPARVTAKQIKALYPDLDLEVIRNEELFSESGRGQFEIADLLLLTLILFLFLEGYLACRFARHKTPAGSETR